MAKIKAVFDLYGFKKTLYLEKFKEKVQMPFKPVGEEIGPYTDRLLPTFSTLVFKFERVQNKNEYLFVPNEELILKAEMHDDLEIKRVKMISELEGEG